MFSSSKTTSLSIDFLECGESEECKSWKNIEKITEKFHRIKGTKNHYLMAIGGGAVCDSAAFAASILLRGLKLILIPTTLLAMVDASIGGKTAINSIYGKNSLGSFYPADLIVIASCWLESLTENLWNEGLSEIIKCALVKDVAFFYLIEASLDLWKSKNKAFIDYLLKKSIELKLEITQIDPTDQSMRNILNFGHTIGHALECYYDYKVPHGRCIAWGMVAEMHTSRHLSGFSESEYQRVMRVLTSFNLLSPLPSSFDTDAILELLYKDKKALKKELRCVLLKTIGEVSMCKNLYLYKVDEELIKAALSSITHYGIYADEILSHSTK